VFQHVLRDTPELSPEEVRTLVQQLHEGDGTARDQLLGSQYRLIFKVAQKFAGKVQRPDLVEDFFQDGVAALTQALDRFDPSKGALSTFTVTVSQRAMWRFFREDSFEPAEDALDGRMRGHSPGSGVENAELESDAISYLAPAPDPRVELLTKLIVLLPDDEAMILEGFLNRMTQKEMAASFGMSEKSVQRKFASAKGRLRAWAPWFEEHVTAVA
jgi:RNA polymerase sigma factor (sigma-70 family)